LTWLLQPDISTELRSLARSATPEQRERFAMSAAARAEAQLVSTAGATAEIKIDGVLTERPSFLAMLLGLGGTTYRDIRSALASAAANPNVKQAVLNISSPGGHVLGLFETLAALETFPKPLSVRASYATSAAYALAAMGGRIEAVTAASQFGSIGVAITLLHDEHVIDVTSTEAPNKRPDPTTAEGKAVIRRDLDALHDLFVEAIAKGRSRSGRATKAAEVNGNFGRGSTLVAREARRVGMIDAIARPANYSAGSEMAAAERFLSVSADIDAGKIKRHPWESREQFVQRCVQLSMGTLDCDDDAPSAGRGDLGDQIVEAYERMFPSRQRAAADPEPVRAAATGGDLGDQIVARLEAQRGTVRGG
jgi:ClpP class serine protease